MMMTNNGELLGLGPWDHLIPFDLRRIPAIKAYLSRKPSARWRTTIPRVVVSSLPEDPRDRAKAFFNSFEEEYLSFTAELADVLSGNFLPDPVRKGEIVVRSDAPIAGNFHAIRTVSGFPATPFGCPISGNRALRESLGLSSSLTERQIRISKWVIEKIWGELDFGPVAVPKATSPGPFGPVDPIWDIRSSRPATREAKMVYQARLIGRLVYDLRIGSLVPLLAGTPQQQIRAITDFGAVRLMYRLHRGQADSVRVEGGALIPKVRNYLTEEEARAGRYDGSHAVSKEVRLRDGKILKGFFAVRQRDVAGVALPINLPGMLLGSCVRRALKRKFPFVFHHTGLDDIKRKLRRCRTVVPSDAKHYDSTYMFAFLKLRYDFLLSRYGKIFADYAFRTSTQPLLMHDPFTGKALSSPFFGHGILAQPGQMEEDGFDTLASGNWDTSLSGRDLPPAAFMDAFIEAGLLADDPTEWELLWQGTHPRLVYLCGGDDNCCGVVDESMDEVLAQAISSSSMVRMEPDANFMGALIHYTSDGFASASVDLTSLVRNCFFKEYNQHEKTNPALMAGYAARFALMTSHPAGSELIKVIDSVMRRRLGISLTELCVDSVSTYNPSLVDAMVLDDPRVLHYKVEEGDVSEDVLTAVSFTIPEPDARRALSTYVNC